MNQTPSRDIQEGDRVKVILAATPTCDESFIGHVGHVSCVHAPDESSAWPTYSVVLDDGRNDFFYADEIEVIRS